ncbi:hypothetical protein AB0C91_40445 [Streptomyces sp. NPDC048674]|uniref:hypothetical protein n=1 Tax=Streptomyces sp. NPDC048674 TaxID=3155491 RepID=UPI0034217B4E
MVNDLDGGGTILLDSDCTSAPGSWRTTRDALPRILDTCAHHGFDVVALRDYGWPQTR